MTDVGEIRVCLNPEDIQALQKGEVVEKIGTSPGLPPDMIATVRLVARSGVVAAVLADEGLEVE